MNTADIDPTALPNEMRCTAHLFDPDESFWLPLAHSGSPLRISHTPHWPPDILFDAVYAGAVLHHFSTDALKAVLTSSWKNIFYPDGVMTTAEADKQVIEDERAATEKRTNIQAEEREERHISWCSWTSSVPC
jgi:hypothetical protein